MAERRRFSYIRTGLVLLACIAPIWCLSWGRDRAVGAAKADGALLEAFERATYSLEASGDGVWRGTNRAQRLALEFSARGATLSHPDGSLSFHLAGYGYGDRLHAAPSVAPTATGNRLEYRRGDLTEWYMNGAQGLEQGFTLSRRPATEREGEPLVIALGVTGGLMPVRKTDDDSVRFESSKGAVLGYGGLRTQDARGRILPSRLQATNHEIRLIVEDRDAQYPVIVDPTWTQQQESTASDGAVNDYFGLSVSVSGDTAVIGADGKNSYQGAAYVFVRSGGVWSQQQELTASDGATGDRFGYSVSVAGDTAVIGAEYKNSGRGVAYVFVRSGGVWTQQQEVSASDGAPANYFGGSVSVSGDTAAIGAYQNNSNQGAAYVFVRSGGVWSQQQKLVASDGAAGDYLGGAVSVSGDTAVIGASGKNSGQGAAYVFVRAGSVWSQQQKLAASDVAAYDYSGNSVSVSGDTAVIGASNKNTGQGAAYVFVRSGSVWSQQQKLAASDGVAFDAFAYSVAVSGDTAAIGAEGRNGAQGSAYVFVRSGGVWTQQQELAASDGASAYYFGYSVSVSGDTAVIAAPYTRIGSHASQGSVYVFTPPPNTPGPPTQMTANSGTTGQAAGIGTAFGTLLSVTVTDANNNPVQGVAVTFTAPSTGASGTFANGTVTTLASTDSSGVATATVFTTNLTVGGPYNVTATASGLPTVSFAMTNLPLPITTSQVSVMETGFVVNRATGMWTSTMTVTNRSSAPIVGPVQVVLANLTATVTMTNKTGLYNGNPYITVSAGSIASGGSVSVCIQFMNPSKLFIAFTPVAYSGAL